MLLLPRTQAHATHEKKKIKKIKKIPKAIHTHIEFVITRKIIIIIIKNNIKKIPKIINTHIELLLFNNFTMSLTVKANDFQAIEVRIPSIEENTNLTAARDMMHALNACVR